MKRSEKSWLAEDRLAKNRLAEDRLAKGRLAKEPVSGGLAGESFGRPGGAAGVVPGCEATRYSRVGGTSFHSSTKAMVRATWKKSEARR